MINNEIAAYINVSHFIKYENLIIQKWKRQATVEGGGLNYLSLSLYACHVWIKLVQLFYTKLFRQHLTIMKHFTNENFEDNSILNNFDSGVFQA